MGQVVQVNFRKPKEDLFDYFYSTCVQYIGKRQWCPKLSWYLDSPCPFSTRHECDLYKEMCGRRIR